MFAGSPSPNKCSIKEANEHLQLLHQRVEELETTVQEQAEALIKKDDAHQTEINDLILKHEIVLQDLIKNLDQTEERLRRSGQIIREKDALLDQLSQRFSQFDDLTSFTPVLERLVYSLKKIPVARCTGSRNHVLRPRNRTSKNHSNKLDHKKAHISIPNQGHNAMPMTMNDGMEVNDANVVCQPMSDLRIKRSFKINSNFSMSEDELDNGDLA